MCIIFKHENIYREYYTYKYVYIYNAHFNLLQTIANKPQFEVVYNSPCGFPGGLVGKESACSAGDPGSIPGWGRSPEKEMAAHSSILA